MKKIQNKIILLLVLSVIFIFTWAGGFYFQTYNVTATGTQLYPAPLSINRFSGINTSTTTVYYKMYDFKPFYTGTVITTAPSYTVYPKYNFQCFANTQLWNNVINSPSSKTVMTFTNGCYIRCTIGFAPTNTVTPTDTCYFDADF